VEKKETHYLRRFSAGFCKGFRLVCGAVLGVSLTALFGCLDIPDAPNESQYIERVEVFLFQEGSPDSTLLKIRPNDSAVVKASVYPRQFKKNLTFHWLYSKGDSTIIVGDSAEYTIPPSPATYNIPNALEVFDEVGNTIHQDFKITVNMAPVLYTTTIPTDGDTLYGNVHTSIRFWWNSYDYDSFDENKLQHTLIIDGVAYPVSSLTEVVQSGFTEGAHTFQIIVKDTFGDADTLSPRSFYMLDTLGGAL
jgi:hypothetical protein